MVIKHHRKYYNKKMANKDKLKGLLAKLNELENSLPNGEVLTLVERVINDKYKDVTSKVKEDASLQALETINKKLNKIKKDLDLGPLAERIEELQKSLEMMHDAVTFQFDEGEKSVGATKEELQKLVKDSSDGLSQMTAKQIKEALSRMDALENRLSFQDSDSKKGIEQVVKDLDARIHAILEDFNVLSGEREMGNELVEQRFSDTETSLKSLTKELGELRADFISKISRGGSANRQINVNSSVMSTKYTDINFQEFGNIRWSATNDDVNKRVNIRASIIVGGGGGPGGGITRSVSVLSVSSTLADDASTDYTFFTNVGVVLTLPTAISNTNRYSIKNMSASSVLVSASAGQDIDGATTALLTRQYEAIDLMSNGSVFGVF